MNISAEVNAIVEQAPDWNFAGDCALLALMKRISQNLHERGESTSQKLREFETNVRITDIALNNATNSLRSLQFGQQFVEYRIEEVDDDDFGMPETQTKPLPPEKGSEEMAKEFLENNLKMFRKNFEPVTLDVPDSDDDDNGGEAAKEQTTFYRPKNPYDAIPVPYIIGSKEWQENKYAGLYDSKENSEDEQTDEFSSSSSDEKDEPPKSEAQLRTSDSSSVASLRKEPAVAEVKQATPSPPKSAPRTQPRPIISSQRQQQPHEHDLFAALRQSPPSDDPPSTSSSLRSSPAFEHLPAARGGPSLSSSSSSAAQQPPPPKLFEREENSKSVPTKLPKEVTPRPSNPIKRMPVNLFNDDEFNSFMTEIVDKAEGKTTSAIEKKEVPAAKRELEEQKQKNPEIEIKAKSINLFDDSPPLSPALHQLPPKTTSNTKPAVSTLNSLPKSLFYDDLDDDDDFLSTLTAKSKAKTQHIEQITKKTLFDDIEDDDDLFGTPKVVKPLPRNPLAEKEEEEVDEKMEPIEIVYEEILPEEISEANPVAKSINVIDLFNEDFSDDEIKTVLGTNPPKIEPMINVAKDEQLRKPAENDGKQDSSVSKELEMDSENDDLFKKSILKSKQDSSHFLRTPSIDSDSEDLFKKPQKEPLPETVSDSDDDSVKGEHFDKVKKDSTPVAAVKPFENPILSDSPPPDTTVEKKDEDPIMSMVAEVTSNRKDGSPSYKPADAAAVQTIMQNYTSLFSDEPPDDSEFFQSLANSNLSSLSASKIFQDQDFFEPALPKIPSANKSTSTGIFSDVPPEDDDFTPPIASVKVLGNTTRIHTIFYDDFSETARAGSAVGAGTPAHQDEVDRHIAVEPPISPVKKLKMPNLNINVQALMPGLGPKLIKKMDMPVEKEQDTCSSDNTLRHVNKTRVRGPAQRRPSTRRGRKENYAKTLQDKEPQQTESVEEKAPKVPVKLIDNFLGSDEDNDDPLFGSVRAAPFKETPKISALVKPSSKLFDDSEDDDHFTKETHKTSAKQLLTKEPIQKNSVPPEKPLSELFEDSENDVLARETANLKVKEPAPKKSVPSIESQSNLFDDSEDDDHFANLTHKTSAKPAPQLLTIEPTMKNVKPSGKLFDDSEDDDDLFASAILAPAAAIPVSTKSTATAKVTPNPKNVPLKTTKSLFSDDEDDDDLFGIQATKPKAHNVVKPVVPATVVPKSSSSSKTIPLSTDNPLSDLLDFE